MLVCLVRLSSVGRNVCLCISLGVMGLPWKLAMIIMGSISSVVFRDFRASGLSSMPSPPMVAPIEFFHAEAEIKVQPFPTS